MLIHVNLLPGQRKRVLGAAAGSRDLAAVFSGLRGRIRDPWLIGCLSVVILSMTAVGLLFTSQQASAGEIAGRLEHALRDSTRLTNVLEAHRQVTAERDSVQRQVQIIRTIDDNRYVWAHLLDEISNALPAYTWLLSLEQTSKATLPPGAAAVVEDKPTGRPAARGGKAAEVALDTIEIHQAVTFRLIGQTVDMQALTLFMKDLEASPFVQHVMLMKSEIVVVDQKDITQFQIEAEYEVAPAERLTTEPLIVPVR
jgi:Tfp pilus assembly protein PilN